jgi:hypothetical protein
MMRRVEIHCVIRDSFYGFSSSIIIIKVCLKWDAIFTDSMRMAKSSGRLELLKKD